jgi:hypothetical protein
MKVVLFNAGSEEKMVAIAALNSTYCLQPNEQSLPFDMEDVSVRNMILRGQAEYLPNGITKIILVDRKEPPYYISNDPIAVIAILFLGILLMLLALAIVRTVIHNF